MAVLCPSVLVRRDTCGVENNYVTVFISTSTHPRGSGAAGQHGDHWCHKGVSTQKGCKGCQYDGLEHGVVGLWPQSRMNVDALCKASALLDFLQDTIADFAAFF